MEDFTFASEHQRLDYEAWVRGDIITIETLTIEPKRDFGKSYPWVMRGKTITHLWKIYENGIRLPIDIGLAHSRDDALSKVYLWIAVDRDSRKFHALQAAIEYNNSTRTITYSTCAESFVKVGTGTENPCFHKEKAA